MALYRSRGYPVKLISVTDGARGHQSESGAALTRRRRAEADAAARVIGAECAVWEFPDGRLELGLELRERIMSEMRAYMPDLVITHRPYDYHPDHRAVGQAVMDAGYLVTVPAIVPNLPALPAPPVIAQVGDFFTRPIALRPDIVIDVEDQLSTLAQMLDCHASQVYEWLPYTRGEVAEVPSNASERLAWLCAQVKAQKRATAERFQARLAAVFDAASATPEYVEVYEISEYGCSLDPERRARLFPWHGRRR